MSELSRRRFRAGVFGLHFENTRCAITAGTVMQTGKARSNARAPASGRRGDQAAAIAARRFLIAPYPEKPTPAKPRSIMTQVDGSGTVTLETSVTVVKSGVTVINGAPMMMSATVVGGLFPPGLHARLNTEGAPLQTVMARD